MPQTSPFLLRDSTGVGIQERHFEAGKSYPLRCNGRLELYYIRSGNGYWHAGSRKMRVQAGDILTVSDLADKGRVRAGTEPLLVDILTLSAGPLGSEGLSFPDWTRPRVLRRSQLAAECAATMRDCHYEMAQAHPGWEDYVFARVQILLVHFYRQAELRRQRDPDRTSRSDLGRVRVIAYIRRLDESFGSLDTLENVADSLKMSPRRFSELFRSVTGMTWLKYVHSLRVAKAKTLLTAKDDPASLIAYQAGFQDVATFHRVFKNCVGLTPMVWRNRSRSELIAR